MINFAWLLLLPFASCALLSQSVTCEITVGNTKEQTPLVALDQAGETLATRTYFYVGGEYVNTGLLSHVFQKQMYVEQLVPQGGPSQELPIVFIHGKAQTGTNWLNTADGRQGWASWFLKQGYTIYIVDQPQRGRSAYTPGDGKLDTFSAEEMAMMFTAVQKLPLWPQARLHTQWPGAGSKGDQIFDAFFASNVPYQDNTSEVQSMMQAAGATLLDKIGPAILITHSEGGPLGFIVADARPDLVKKLISVEPEGPPFKNRFPPGLTVVRPYGLTVIPIAYDPAVTDASPLANKETESAGWDLSKCNLQASPARQLANLSKVPHLVVTGEASFHAMYDYCTVDFLQQGGAKVDYLNLSSYGIHGNAHFLFMELNNLDIAAMIEGWIQNGTLV